MNYIVADPNDPLFSHNLKFCKGMLYSASFMRKMDTNLSGAISPYEYLHTDKEKEAIFENVRKEYYPNLPSRMGALFLFPNLETAKKANQI